jgi:hypothetical protein
MLVSNNINQQKVCPKRKIRAIRLFPKLAFEAKGFEQNSGNQQNTLILFRRVRASPKNWSAKIDI